MRTEARCPRSLANTIQPNDSTSSAKKDREDEDEIVVAESISLSRFTRSGLNCIPKDYID